MTNGLDTHTPTVLSICTGAGGLDLGFKLALPSSRTVCYIEREAFALVNLAAAMEAQHLDDAPVWDDLRTFDGKPWRGLVDFIIGGIPCQPHSVAGRKRGANDERDLWDDTARVIGEVRPRLVFLENVANIMGYYHERIGEELQAMGYETEEGLFSAEEVGAPHFRQRFFVLGYNGGREYLANALSVGWGGRDNKGRWARCNEDAGVQTARPSGEFCDTYGKGWEVLGRTGQAESPFELQALFPPSPDDYDGWAYMLGEMPSLEPALCRMADEFTQQMDRTVRLSLVGNSVVPLVAAVALRTLAHTATQGD